MLNFGLALIAVAIIDDDLSGLKWLWEQLKKPIENLTRTGLKWYRRVVALGQICLLVGLFLVVLDVARGDNGSNDTPAPTTTTTT